MGRDFFWDTSGFFALLNTRDEAHDKAREFIATAQTECRRGVTTAWVIGETCTLLLARKRPQLASKFLDHIKASQALWCIHPDEAHFGRAAAFFRKHLDQGYSFTDSSSMVLMRELRIRTVLSTDRHFVEAGFDVALANT